MVIDIISKLKSSGMLDILNTLLSTLIPLIVLFATLKHNQKQSTIQLKQQHEEHLNTIKKMEHQHTEQLEQQSEQNRISAMPYLIIEKSGITTHKERGTTYFTIHFINKGNGTAINLTEKCISDSPELDLCPMCKTVSSVYGCACPFSFETDVLKINDTSYMMLYRKLVKAEASKHGDKVTFKIMFQDMYLNQYEQQFMFLFSNNASNENIQISRVSVNSPMLCKNNSYDANHQFSVTALLLPQTAWKPWCC